MPTINDFFEEIDTFL